LFKSDFFRKYLHLDDNIFFKILITQELFSEQKILINWYIYTLSVVIIIIIIIIISY
jgi:hypothetical protein